MRTFVLSAMMLLGSAQAFGFGTATISDVRTNKIGTSFVDCAGTNVNVGKDNQSPAISCLDDDGVPRDADAEDLTFLPDNCDFVTAGDINTVNQDNCYTEYKAARVSEDGEVLAAGHDIGRRNSTATYYTVTNVPVRQIRRAIAAAHCSSSFARVTGTTNACTLTCSNFGSTCESFCNAVQTENCGSGSCSIAGQFTCGVTDCAAVWGPSGSTPDDCKYGLCLDEAAVCGGE